MESRKRQMTFAISGVILLLFIGSSTFVMYQKMSITVNACQFMYNSIWTKDVAMPVNNGHLTSYFNTVDESHKVPHNGVDIAATGNVYAVVGGVVVENTYNTERGYMIVIAFKGDDQRYYTYLYQHLAYKSPIAIGSEIELGQVVGTVGNSGYSFGTHLHAEVELAQMIDQKPTWVGTYPVNLDKMFDFIQFFRLSDRFENGRKGLGEKERCRIQLYGRDNEERIWNFFIQAGFTNEGAAGIIGNLIVESHLDPLAGEIGGSGGGRGIAQWGQCGTAFNGAHAGCRWQRLEAWAKRGGMNPDELGTQLQYLLKEMEEYQMIDYFKQIKILYMPTGGYGGGSVGYFASQFERPSLMYAHMNQRYHHAKIILQKFESMPK